MDKWDLSVIYKNEEEFNNECDNVKKKLLELKEMEKSCFDNASNLYEFLSKDSEISILVDKLYSYASMNLDLDTSNNKALSLKEKAKDIYDEYNKVVSFFTPKLLSFSSEDINKFYDERSELDEYKVILDRIYRYKDHTLSEKEEKLLAKINSVFNRNEDIYDMLTDCDLTFGSIIDEDGKEVELTQSNYKKYIESTNRSVRKSAFEMLHNTYKKFGNTICSAYYGEINELKVFANIKNYNSILDMVVFDDEIDTSVYKNLVKVVNKRLDVIYNYFKIKKNMTKLDEFHLYDGYLPLVEVDKSTYTYEEAKDLVLKSLSVLGSEYVEILKEGYDNGWVDVYPSKAKRSGAYSGGSYLTMPYILLNYESRYDDVSTLAHESGHSMHSYYARKYNKPEYGHYKIFVAEVASTVNELLLANYMLENSDDVIEKKFILDRLMSLYKATIYRQTMFAEFEEISYNLVENGVALTQDILNEKYLELNKKYFGPDVVIDKEIQYEWLRIPHFYYKFYVYKYATGLSAATYIVKNILSSKKDARENYIKFLKAGCTLSPIDSLKLAGVDLTREEVIESAIDYFKELQDEFVSLCK